MVTKVLILLIPFICLCAAEVSYLQITPVLYSGTCGGYGEYLITTNLTEVSLTFPPCLECRVKSITYEPFDNVHELYTMGLQTLQFYSKGLNDITMKAKLKSPNCARTNIVVDQKSLYQEIKPLGLFQTPLGTEVMQLIPSTLVPGITITSNILGSTTMFMDITTSRFCGLAELELIFYDNNPTQDIRCTIYRRDIQDFVHSSGYNVLLSSYGNATAIRRSTLYYDPCVGSSPALEFSENVYGVLECSVPGTNATWTNLYIAGVRVKCWDRPLRLYCSA